MEFVLNHLDCTTNKIVSITIKSYSKEETSDFRHIEIIHLDKFLLIINFWTYFGTRTTFSQTL